ncbi:MAG: glycosyl hydrolase family 8 [Terrimicrobiaceae bacterium]
MIRRVLIGALAVALLAGLAWFAILRREGPYDLRRADWAVFRENCVAPDGRVIDTGNGNISHSEGQGYAMLFAVAYQDRVHFDSIWNWTRKNLQTRTDDKLISWLWKPDGKGGGAVADPNNASDGDLLVAWALVRAGRLWGDFSYTRSALEILADLRRLNIVEFGGRPTMLPGTVGFQKDDGLVLNPSYFIFQAFRELEEAFPHAGWAALALSGRDLIRESRFGEFHLPTEWVFTKPSSALEPAPGFTPDFGYNAIRVPLYVLWENPASDLLVPFREFWGRFRNSPPPATVNVMTGDYGPDPALPGMLSIAKAVEAAATKEPLTVAALEPVERGEVYYSACLKLLVALAVNENAKAFGKESSA